MSLGLFRQGGTPAVSQCGQSVSAELEFRDDGRD